MWMRFLFEWSSEFLQSCLQGMAGSLKIFRSFQEFFAGHTDLRCPGPEFIGMLEIVLSPMGDQES
jgi:hypothetical protein